MRNIVILFAFITVFLIAILNEPFTDTIDALAGSTNPTYSTTIDSYAGVSEGEDEDDEEDDEDEDDN